MSSHDGPINEWTVVSYVTCGGEEKGVVGKVYLKSTKKM